MKKQKTIESELENLQITLNYKQEQRDKLAEELDKIRIELSNAEMDLISLDSPFLVNNQKTNSKRF